MKGSEPGTVVNEEKTNWKIQREEYCKDVHSSEMTHDNEVTQSQRTCPCSAMCFLPKRYMVAMLSFLGFANIYAMRVNLSVAIAVMVANQTVIQDGKEVQVF